MAEVLEGDGHGAVHSETVRVAIPPRGRWRAWLDRRIPAQRCIRLNRGNIFIFPSLAGFAFLGLIALLVLAAINYQNSMVFGLAFLLASTFVLTIGHTYRNLAGLEIEAAGVRPVFAGEHAEFALLLRRTSRVTYHALWLGFPGGIPQNVDLDGEKEARVRIPALARQRGWFDPGRLRLQTHWPLGLFRAWTWLDLDQTALVYPKPRPVGPPRRAALASEGGEELLSEGNDDFVGLRHYRPGDALKHMAWKNFAREGELMVKEYAGHADRRLWLDWDAVPGLDEEARLSVLTGWVLDCAAQRDAYGLRLPGVEISPAAGEEHRARLLRTLALFGREQGERS